MLEWISAESWQAFREMRRKMRAPLTPYAERLILRELCRLKALGHDPQAVLDQSIMLAWRDVFPLRERAAAHNGGTGALDEIKAHRAAESAPVSPEVMARVRDVASKIRMPR